MRKLMLANQLHSFLLPSILLNLRFTRSKPLLSFFTSLFTLFQNRSYSATPLLNHENSVLADYLVNSLKFSETSALKVTNQFLHIKSLEKPKAVVCFFKTLSFSDTQIQSSVRRRPRILFADVEKTLKPKVLFFQELGLSGPHLGVLISKNPNILSNNLDKSLRPCIELLKRILKQNGSNTSNDDINNDIFCILWRSRGIIVKDSQLLSSITYLESCGIVGSQLIMLLKNDLKVFLMREGELRALVSRVTEFGFVLGSRMLVYGVLAFFSTSIETRNRKLELFLSFGFSRHEFREMLVKNPTLFRSSDAKLRRGIEFLLHTLKLDKSVAVRMPVFFTMSMEKRVLPRYRVLEMIKSRKLLDRDPSFMGMLGLSNVKFVEKYISRFAFDARELLAAYEGHVETYGSNENIECIGLHPNFLLQNNCS